MRLIDADAIPEVSLDPLEEKAFRETIEGMPTIDAEPKWIPCSEKLPAPRAESYWVCTDGAYQHECRWTNINPFWTDRTTEWHWNLFDTPPYSEVVAWMPLPEPYRAESEDKE